jgi:hypothetical protein
MSAAMTSATDGLDFRFRGKCEGGTGPDLSRYPTLTYAPLQWGEGIRTGSKGVPVDAIAADALANGAVDQIDDLMTRHSATFAEVLDSLDYARANGLI